MKHIVFGVDIGGTAVKIGLFDGEGALREKWSIETRVVDDERGILRDVAAALDGKLSQLGLDRTAVRGIGMGIPGPVLEDGTVNRCVNLGWGRFNVQQAMAEIAGVPVKAGNDANVAALGEQWLGGGAGFSTIVMVTLGTGVGGGMVVDGRILNGSGGAAGEIGHMHMYDDEAQQCGCGKRGCLEQYTSANGIVHLARRFVGEDAPFELSSIGIFQAARAGNGLAQQIVDEMFTLLGKALAAVSCALDPEAYVIGGGVSNEGQYLIDGIQAAYERYAFHACRHTKIMVAKLGNDAGMYGAAKLVMDVGTGREQHSPVIPASV